MIVDAVLAGRIRAGMRQGARAFASLFRTSVREALIRLATCGIVQVSPNAVGSLSSPRLKRRRKHFRHDAPSKWAFSDHERITAPRVAGDLDRAARLMTEPIGSVAAGPTRRIDRDPRLDLRQALPITPENAGPNPPRQNRPAVRNHD